MEKKKEYAFFPLSVCLSVRLSLPFRSSFYISSFNSLSLSLSLSIQPSVFTSLCNTSISPFVILLFFFFTFSRNIDHYRYSLSALRNVSPVVSPFRSPSVSEGRDELERFCSASLIAIHTFLRSSILRTRNNASTSQPAGRRNPVYQSIAIGSIINDKYFTNLRTSMMRYSVVRTVSSSRRACISRRLAGKYRVTQHGRMGKGCLNG